MVVWCLLLVWGLYGGLELAEELRMLEKVQAGPDLDMEALVQLASGIKPEVPTLADSTDGQVGTAFTSYCLASRINLRVGPHRFYCRKSSLRRHQLVLVYRI